MTSREQEICMLIKTTGESASIAYLSKASGLSAPYIEMIIQCLVESGFIKYHGRKACYLTAKGKAFAGDKNKERHKGVEIITRPLTDILKSIHMLSGNKYKK